MRNTKLLLGLVFLFVISFVSAAPLVNVTSSNVTVTGTGDLNITYLNSSINNASILQDQGGGVYQLNTQLYISSGTINTTFTNYDLTWLKINGTSGTLSFTSAASPGQTWINNTKFSSWLDNDFDYNPNNGRASITFSSSGLYIANTTFLYLGNLTWTTPSSGYGTTYNGGGGRVYIINSNFTGMYMAVHIGSTGMDKANISGNVFFNNSYDDIYISTSAGLKNVTIINNSFFKPGRHSIEMLAQVASGSRYNIISGNNFHQNQSNIFGNILVQGNDTIISNNNFYGGGTIATPALKTTSTNNLILANNYLEKTQYSFWIFSNDYNVTIINNTIVNSDTGSDIRQGNLLWFINNTVRNITADYDGYDVGIKIKNFTNVYIIGNNFSEIATTAILLQKDGNVTISNNFFDTIPMSQRNLYAASDYRDPQCAISIVELFESYLGSGDDNDAFGNISYLSQYKSDNVTIIGNVFDSDTSCVIRSEGTTNLNYDITNYWYRKLWTPTFLKDPMEFWINNNHNNLSSWYSASYNTNLSSAYNNDNTKLKMRFTVLKNYIYVENRNVTQVWNTTIYNQTNSLIYFSNGTGFICSNDCNFTLTPKNWSYILDMFNVTEGTNRLYSPIWFTSSSGSSKAIASNLTNSISTNLVFNVDTCDNIGNIYYKPYGSAQVKYSRGSYTCANNVVNLGSVTINPSSSSNTITIEYACSIFTRLGYSLIMIFSSIAILGASIYYLFKDGIEGFSLEKVMMCGIILTVGVVLWMATGQNLGGSCPVT